MRIDALWSECDGETWTLHMRSDSHHFEVQCKADSDGLISVGSMWAVLTAIMRELDRPMELKVIQGGK